jgi:parallel beta-helix repeat protein
VPCEVRANEVGMVYRLRTGWICLAFTVFLAGAAGAVTLRVPGQFATIQDAIDAAGPGDIVMVSPGTYEEGFDFNGKAITVRSVDPTDPEIVAATLLDGRSVMADELVRFRDNETRASVLSGFTISYCEGDAIECDGSSPTIANNAIRVNSAGGAIWLHNGAAPRIANNLLYRNSVGIYCSDAASPLIVNNTISFNSFGGITGANRDFNPTVRDNVIDLNGNFQSGGLRGSAIECYRGYIVGNIIRRNGAKRGGGISLAAGGTVDNNLIVGNVASEYGGGVYCVGPAVFRNNTICDNKCEGSATGGNVYLSQFDGLIQNCIVAFATAGGGIVQNGGTPYTINYCDVYSNVGGNYGGLVGTGTGNIVVDPLFVDRNLETGFYRLKSAGGHWNGTGWVIDAVTSPCIDAGDPGSAYNAEPVPNGGRINMGFDGNTAHASKSGSVIVPAVIACGPRGTFRPPITCNIFCRFNVPMKQGSVENNLYINGVKATAGEFFWVGTKVTYNPTNNLQERRRYQIRIAKAAQSRTGVRMAADMIWNFTTNSYPTPPPAVIVFSAPTVSGTQISVNLAAAANVAVSIRNLAGREVAVLRPGQLEAGVHSLLWDGRSRAGTNTPSGAYLMQAQARDANGQVASAIAPLRR